MWRTTSGLFFGALLIGGAVWAAPAIHSAPAIVGTVADAKTGKPVAGAVVQASWVLEPEEEASGILAAPRLLLVHQTQSDTQGRYRISAWSEDQPAPPGWRLKPGHDPILSVHAAGYRRLVLDNQLTTKIGTRPYNATDVRERRSRWDGKTLRLKNTGSPAAWMQELAGWRNALETGITALEWKERDQAWFSHKHLLVLFDAECGKLPPERRQTICWAPDSRLGVIAANLRSLEKNRGQIKFGAKGTPQAAGIFVPAGLDTNPMNPINRDSGR